MRVVTITTAWQEADIIGDFVQHTLSHGVDEILVAYSPSDDGTGDILRSFSQVSVILDTEPYHMQPMWMSQLAYIADAKGADWIIASDCDEFWYATEGGSIPKALDEVPETIGKVCARQYRQWGDYRQPVPNPHPKVAFRAHPTAQVANGNHDVTGIPGLFCTGVLDLRERHFRSVEHMKRKVAERLARIDPSLPITDGAHIRELGGFTDAEFAARYEEMVALGTVYDPIP